MDLIFQSGEFYLTESTFFTDFLINAFGALIGTLTALAIFFLQTKHERKLKIEQNNVFIRQKIHYFSSMIGSILELSKKQEAELKQFHENQKKITLQTQKLGVFPDNNLKRFSEIHNHEDYYHAYLSIFGYNSQTVIEYRNFYEIIDFLYLLTIQFKSILDKAIQFDYDAQLKYKESVEVIVNEVAVLLNKYKLTSENKLFSDFLDEILSKFYSDEKYYTTLNGYQEMFVRPLMNGIVINFRNIDEAVLIASKLKSAGLLYTEIITSNLYLAEDFEKIHEKYKNYSDKLEQHFLKLNNKFTVNI